MNPQVDVADLTERIRQTGIHAPIAHHSGNGTPSPTGLGDLPRPDRDLPPLPQVPKLAPAEPADPVPLAEATNMIPRAREKLTVKQGVPGVLRPMFRNQGGFNGVLLETCGRLVEVGAQLRQENLELRRRLDALVEHLGAQNVWLETLARSSTRWMDVVQERFGEQDARSHRAEIRLDQAEALLTRLRAEGDEHAGSLARLETQHEQYLAWMQNLQAQADVQIERDADVEARIARQAERSKEQQGQIQELSDQAARNAEHLRTADLRLDETGGHINHLQTYDDRQTGRLDALQRRLEEAVAADETLRSEMKQAAAQQHLLEANHRRLDERQISDANHLRAQLAFHQRLMGELLAPDSPDAGGRSGQPQPVAAENQEQSHQDQNGTSGDSAGAAGVAN